MKPESAAELPEDRPDHARLARLETLFRRVLRVTISDGRIFIGTFAGTDQPLNILLMNSEEYRVGTGEPADGRYVGQIVIPWKLIVKVESETIRPRRTQNNTTNMMII